MTLEWLSQLCGSAMKYIGLDLVKCLRLLECAKFAAFVFKKSLLLSSWIILELLSPECVALAKYVWLNKNFKFLKCSSRPPCLGWEYPVYNRMRSLWPPTWAPWHLHFWKWSVQSSTRPRRYWMGEVCSKSEKSCWGHRFHLGLKGMGPIPHSRGFCIKGCASGLNQHFPGRRAKPSLWTQTVAIHLP